MPDFDTLINSTKDLCGIARTNRTYDNLIKRSVNDGQQDFASALNWSFLEDIKSTATVQYKYKYDAPANLDVAKSVVYRKRWYLQPISNDQYVRLLRNQSVGIPRYFYYWQGKLNVLPQPTYATVATTLGFKMTGTDVEATLNAVADLQSKGRLMIGSGASVEVIEYANISGSMATGITRGLEGTQPTGHDVNNSIYYLDLEQTYYKTLVDMTATSETSSISAKYHEAMVQYASARFFESQEDLNQANVFQARYLAMREKAKVDLGEKQTQKYTSTLDDTEPDINLYFRDETIPQRGSLDFEG